MADCRDEYRVRVPRVDGNLADVLRVGKPEMRPALAAVGRLVHTVAVPDRIAKRRFAASDVNDVRAGRCDGKRADRCNRLRVEDRHPRAARIHRLPHAAVHRSEVELVRAPGYAAHRVHSAAAERTEHPPVQSADEVGRERLRAERQRPEPSERAGGCDRHHGRASKKSFVQHGRKNNVRAVCFRSSTADRSS